MAQTFPELLPCQCGETAFVYYNSKLKLWEALCHRIDCKYSEIYSHSEMGAYVGWNDRAMETARAAVQHQTMALEDRVVLLEARLRELETKYKALDHLVPRAADPEETADDDDW